MEVGQSDAGAKRRHKRLLGDAGLEARHAGGGDRQLLPGPIQVERRDGVTRAQPVATLENDFGQPGFRLRRRERGALLAAVQTGQHLPRLDDVA